MEIKDLQPNQGNIDLVLTVAEKGEVRTFEKFGKKGKVCTATVQDDSGEVKLTLWNEDTERIGIGDKISLQKGWCSEYRGEKQLSTGRSGKIEILEKAEQGGSGLLTNDPQLLKQALPPSEDYSEEGAEEVVTEEEMIE